MATSMESNRFNADPAKVGEFATRFMNCLNGGALSMMVAIGHKLGLFDIMGKCIDQPLTSDQIASKANLNERYVREWLGAMVTGQIVKYDQTKRSYQLLPECAMMLTRDSPHNLAVVAQFIPMLGAVQPEIIPCFKNGGGVPYERFEGFHDIMAEESFQSVVRPLVDQILPTLLPDMIKRLQDGIRCLDIGCGEGKAMICLAERFPKSFFRGYDSSREAIDKAMSEMKRKGLRNIEFRVQDVASFDEKNEYDLITAFDAIHDQAFPEKVLQNINRALKGSQATFLMQDIKMETDVGANIKAPLGPFLYTISTCHCMTVSLAAKGDGLGTCWGKQKALELLKKHGFEQVKVQELPHDLMNYWYICKSRVESK